MDEKKKSKKSMFFIIVIILMIVIYLSLCALVRPDHILPNTTVNSISIGNMTLKDAADALETDASARRKAASLSISANGTTYILEIGELLELDCKALSEEALSASQKNFLTRGFFLLKNFFAGSRRTSLPSIKEPDDLHLKLKDSGLLDVDSTIQTSYEEKDGQLVFTLGTAGFTVDEAALTEQINTVLEKGDYGTVITCPMITGKVAPVDIDQLYQEIHTEPVNATLDPDHNYQIMESVRGVDFEKETAQKILKEAREGSEAAVDLIYTEPEITTQDMKNFLFADQLATSTTRVGGSANRITNIQLAASKCNGVILCNGDEFSFNDTVGEQTAETGFQKANATQGEKVIQAYGGGICQVSTTLFIAALYAGLDIPERWCHTYVSSYADPGMDAAVAWGDLDFKIVNNKKYPIKLEVNYSNGNLTVTVWGTKTEITPIEIETKVLNSTSESLEVQTCRKIYSADRENAVISRFYSSYINPSIRQD